MSKLRHRALKSLWPRLHREKGHNQDSSLGSVAGASVCSSTHWVTLLECEREAGVLPGEVRRVVLWVTRHVDNLWVNGLTRAHWAFLTSVPLLCPTFSKELNGEITEKTCNCFVFQAYLEITIHYSRSKVLQSQQYCPLELQSAFTSILQFWPYNNSWGH